MFKKNEDILQNVEEMIKNNLLPVYDEYNLSWFNLNYYRFLETMNALNKFFSDPITLLEVGCSPGYLTTSLKLMGHNVYGIDIEPKKIQNVLKKQNIIVEKCNIEYEKIPFDDNTFHCIIFTEVIEHLNYVYLNFVMNELKRILKNNGLIILSTPNLAALENRILLLFGKEIIRSDHNRVYTLKELVNLLTVNNFTIIQVIFSLSRDIITHKILNEFIVKDHVLKGFIKYPNWKNFGRAITYPLKILIPSFRSCIFLIVKKNNNQ